MSIACWPRGSRKWCCSTCSPPLPAAVAAEAHFVQAVVHSLPAAEVQDRAASLEWDTAGPRPSAAWEACLADGRLHRARTARSISTRRARRSRASPSPPMAPSSRRRSGGRRCRELHRAVERSIAARPAGWWWCAGSGSRRTSLRRRYITSKHERMNVMWAWSSRLFASLFIDMAGAQARLATRKLVLARVQRRRR